MNQQDIEILRDSENSLELDNLTKNLASSNDLEDMTILSHFLTNKNCLERLDKPENGATNFKSLRLAGVIYALMENPESIAHQLLLQLTHASEFRADVYRIQLLIYALSVIRPSPPEAIRFWDQYSDPQGPLVFNVIESLFINQSAPAITLLTEKFAFLELSEQKRKVTWMRNLLLTRRNDEPLLLCCKELILGQLAEDLKPDMIEVLFDYKRDEWFVGCRKLEPPPRSLMSDNAKQILVDIGRHALANIQLTDDLRDQVTQVIDDLSN